MRMQILSARRGRSSIIDLFRQLLTTLTELSTILSFRRLQKMRLSAREAGKSDESSGGNTLAYTPFTAFTRETSTYNVRIIRETYYNLCITMNLHRIKYERIA